MRLVTERKEFCAKAGEAVMITSYTDAECGGYGCAVHTEDVEYECEKQQSCPFYNAEGCCIVL